MGKAKKIKSFTKSRNLPLDKQIEHDNSVKPIKEKNDLSDKGIEFVDARLTKKILADARKQQEDLEEECEQTGSKDAKEKRLNLSSIGDVDGDDSDEDDDQDDEEDETKYEEYQHYEDIKINEEDERALEKFMSKETTQRKTLADYITEKLREKETEIATHFSDAASLKVKELDPRVVELYKGVKVVLSRYRSGKLPKAFKIIPALSNWEEILLLTDPDSWSAAAMFQATRQFTSILKEHMAQRFFNLILLPRIRDDIAEYKRLNFHLYQALRKALFKPGAFFKGIILPLCEGGDCTLREAVIIGSVISRNHIPILHAGAAMLKLAEMNYTGANSVFLNLLISKKYALPFRVIDALVHHFLRFIMDKREFPVLWHQCLLSFVQHYKTDISSEQKDALLELIRAHSHYQITPLLRQELMTSNCRDQEAMEPDTDLVEQLN